MAAPFASRHLADVGARHQDRTAGRGRLRARLRPHGDGRGQPLCVVAPLEGVADARLEAAPGGGRRGGCSIARTLFDAPAEWMGYPANFTAYGGSAPARSGAHPRPSRRMVRTPPTMVAWCIAGCRTSASGPGSASGRSSSPRWPRTIGSRRIRLAWRTGRPETRRLMPRSRPWTRPRSCGVSTRPRSRPRGWTASPTFSRTRSLGLAAGGVPSGRRSGRCGRSTRRSPRGRGGPEGSYPGRWRAHRRDPDGAGVRREYD